MTFSCRTLVLVFLTVLMVGPLTVHSALGNEKPLNFVFILADDLGWRDLGCYGSPFYETPNVDRLAGEGMRFTNAYAACPVCSPTRASILSGKYPARMDTTDWFGAPQPEASASGRRFGKLPLLPARYVEQLPLEEKTIAETLREAGYKTFFAGKWHLGKEGYWPEDQGFDVNKGGFTMGMPPAGYFSPYNNPRLADGPEGEHLPARLANETASFIHENRDAPFLAYLAFYSVHTPLMTQPNLEEKYQRKAKQHSRVGETWGEEGSRRIRLVQDHAVYAGMIEAMDDAVGRVLEAIDESGVADRTVVIFMSDNGGLSTSEGHPTSNLPLRAGKGWLYEGGIRVPMVIKWPGGAAPGTVSHVLVNSTDFYPTLLEMAGLPLNPAQHSDGTSLVPLLKGVESLDREALFWHYPHYGNQGGTPGGAVRRGDWKLTEWYEDGRIELFNLRDDLGETVNQADERPELTRELRGLLASWRDSVSAKMPTPNPGAAP